jgi:hypothetical protein
MSYLNIHYANYRLGTWKRSDFLDSNQSSQYSEMRLLSGTNYSDTKSSVNYAWV